MRGGGGNLLLAADISTNQTTDQNVTDGDTTSSLNVITGGKLSADVKVSTTTAGSVTISKDSQGVAQNKNIIIQTAADGTVTINNENKEFLGNIKYESETDGKANLAINNVNKDATGDADAAKITGTITGAKGTLEITNGSSADNFATISGGITGKAGELTINNYGKITGKTTGGAGALNITNNANGTISGAIDGGTGTGDKAQTQITNHGTISGAIAGKAGDLSITNGGTISNTITGAAGALSITNDGGTISGNITAGSGTTADKATTITNAGIISGTITGAASSLTITNSREITGKITGAAGALEINNNSGATIGEIEGAAGKLTITNDGTITGAITAGTGTKATDSKETTITNNSIISGAITGTDAGNLFIENKGTLGNVTSGKATFSLTNSGSADTIEVKKMTNTADSVTISNSGNIQQVKINEANAVVSINNSGSIASLDFTQAGTAKLGENYAVTLGSKTDYDTNGALGITGTKTNATIQIADSNAFVLNLGDDFDMGQQYSLTNFISGEGTGATLQNSQGAATTLSASQLRTTQNIYDLNIANGTMTISIEANKSIGALGALQSVASMNAQITRAQSIVDSVFDSIATGEIGNLNYPREGYLSSQYTGVNKKSQLQQRIDELHSSEGKGDKLAELVSADLQKNKSWIGFITPYYSTSSLGITGFSASSATSFGFIGGAAKALDNGILLGVHLGVESQNSGKVGQEMYAQGGSFLVGLHSKMPLAQFNKGSITLVPFVKLQLNAMGAVNSYRLTPLLDSTREASGLVGGFSGSALLGLDMPTNFGYFTPEIGLMQQAVMMPKLEYTGFETAANNQTINATTATPMYMLAQIRYTKAIKLKSIGLYPTIKGGLRYAMMGADFTSSITLPSLGTGSTYFGTNTIDKAVGILEVGFGAKFGSSASVNLTYGGEYGAQIKTHNISLRAGWQF